MTNLTGATNLRKYIVELIKRNLDKKLESYCYYDVCKEDELTDYFKAIQKVYAEAAKNGEAIITFLN